MANTVLSISGPEKHNVFKEIPTTGDNALYKAVNSSSKKAEFTVPKDGKVLLLIKNTHESAAKTATVKAGAGTHNVKDLTVSVGSGKLFCAELDSGFFKNLTGSDAGKIIVEGQSVDILCGVIKLI